VTDFAVVQTRFETIALEVMVQVLTEHGGMPNADACRVARRSKGILGEQFTEVEAKAVWNELTRQGYGVRVVPGDQLPNLSDPCTIRWFEIDKEQFRMPDGIHGETMPMDWTSIFTISVGQIAEVKAELVREKKRPSNVFEKSAALYSNEGPRYRKRSKLIDVVDVIGVDQSRV
jgi:hypothetical protein